MMEGVLCQKCGNAHDLNIMCYEDDHAGEVYENIGEKVLRLEKENRLLKAQLEEANRRIGLWIDREEGTEVYWGYIEKYGPVPSDWKPTTGTEGK